MRRPSIHVTEQALVEELTRLGFKLTETDVAALSKALRHRQLRHRSLVLAPTAAQATKLRGQRLADVEVLRLYALLAKSQDDRGAFKFRPVRPGQAGWTDVVALVEAARRFVQAFDITDVDDGVRKYYELALDQLGSRASTRNMAACYEEVVARFTVRLEVYTDPYHGETSDLFKEYVRRARLSTKEAEALRVESVYVHFVRAANQARELGARPARWVQVQFEETEWTGKSPSPKQMYGDQALTRWVSATRGNRPVVNAGPKTPERERYENELNKRKE